MLNSYFEKHRRKKIDKKMIKRFKVCLITVFENNFLFFQKNKKTYLIIKNYFLFRVHLLVIF